MSWFEGFHSPLYAETVLSQRSPQTLNHDVALVCQLLRVRPPNRLYEQCSGIGVMGNELARCGYDIVGVDVVKSYVAQAQRESEGGQFICADARAFQRTDYFDGAFNWWTSIGYSDSDSDNLKMIERAFESLRPGARYLIETMNPEGVFAQFKPTMRRVFQRPTGPVELVRKSEIDSKTNRLEVDWVYAQNDQILEAHHSSVRFYFPEQLKAAFARIGFHRIVLYGPNGDPLVPETDCRYIIVGEKPVPSQA